MKPNTKRAIPFTVFLIMGLFLFLFSVEGSGEFQITTDSCNQSNPAIYGDIVVWEDERNGNKDIYGYNLSTQKEFPICIDPHDQYHPAIYKDIVVWEDHRFGDKDTYQYYWDIRGYDLSTQEEFPITIHKSAQEDPAIYGDYVIWEDEREWRNGKDIYGYNLLTEEEFKITTAPEDQHSPVIYNNIVIWIDERTLRGEIYGYNLSTCQESQITTRDLGWWSYPVMYDEIIVWGEWTLDGRTIIDGYNLSKSREFRIFRDFFYLCRPETYEGMRLAIYEDIVLWVDYRNCNWDIYGYNLRTQKEFQITTDSHDQYSPALYSNIVVWTDERNGNTDIYGFNLLSPATPVFFNYRMKLVFLVIFCGILVALPALISVCREAYVKRTAPERTVFEEPRDFRRSIIPSILCVLAAAVPLSFILYDIIHHITVASSELFLNVVMSILLYFVHFFLSSYLIYGAVWFKRTPYVRMTNKEITIFTHGKIIFIRGKRKEVINWHNIKEINFKKTKVELISSSGRKVEIHLLLVDRRDKEDLVQALRHSPYNVSSSL
ncbi:MAG: hypothetical protein HXS48_27620 [Theionarchaea archaeon]|nr:MAG: hypothetical protein AYK19_01945 [Theionarchaea archaeon DG-70-1]MBU7030732.1 hypothetical protein [Theionarchaea archaeon]